MRLLRNTLHFIFTFLLVLMVGFAANAHDDTLWDELRDGGYVILIRHAIAPGTGDAPGFRLGDCSTQRNLSA